MALETVPWALQYASHGAELFRRMSQSLLAGSGVVDDPDLQVTALSTPAMAVNVAAGQIWIPGTLGATTGLPPNNTAQTEWEAPASFTSQGSYYALSNAVDQQSIAAADASNPRIDLVVATVLDQYYAGSQSEAILQVITGTPAPSGSQVPPTPPASSLVLAEVAVAAAATSITSGDITDLRVMQELAPSGLFGSGVAQGASVSVNGSSTAQLNSYTIPSQNRGYVAQVSASITYKDPASSEVEMTWSLEVDGNAISEAVAWSPTFSGTTFQNQLLVGQFQSESGTSHTVTVVLTLGGSSSPFIVQGGVENVLNVFVRPVR